MTTVLVCPSCKRHQLSLHLKSNLDSLQEANELSFSSRKRNEGRFPNFFQCSLCEIAVSELSISQSFIAQYEDALYSSPKEEAMAANSYWRLFKSDIAALSSKSSFLEIGCGAGFFIHKLLKHNFLHVLGLEPSSDALRSASAEVQPYVRHGNFPESLGDKESFDAVFIFQTLEHLRNPREVLEDVYSRLKSPGFLFVVAHDYLSWQNQMLGEKSPIYDIQHFQLFSQKGLKAIHEAAGFAVIKQGRIWNTYPLSYWLSLLPSQFPKSSVPKLIQKLPISLSVGNQYLVAKKS